METPESQHRATPGPSHFVRNLALAVFAINAFFVAVVGAMLYESRGYAVEKATVYVENLARVLDEYIAGTIDEMDIVLRVCADEIERQSAGGSIAPKRLNDFLDRNRQRIPELDGLRVTNAGGEVVFGNDLPVGTRVVLADRDYFQGARAAGRDVLVISKPLRARISGKWVVIFARRFNRADGSFAGIVYGLINLDRFSQMFSTLEMGPHGFVTLGRDDFTTIARYPDLPGNVSATGKMTMAPEVVEQVRRGSMAGTVEATSPFDGKPKTVAFRKLQDYPLQIMIGIAPEDYLAPWRIEAARMAGLVGLFALTTLLFSGGAYRSWRRRAKGIAQLAASAARLNEAQRIAHLDNWEWNIETDELIWSDESFRIFGLEPQSVTPSRDLFMSMVLPEARDRLLAEMNRTLGGDGPYSCEFGIARADGEVRHVLGQAIVIKDADGKPLRMVGTNLDITERKRADAARAQIARALRLLTDCSSALLRAADEQKLLDKVCRLIVETGGYRMAWVGYAADDADKSVRPIAQSSDDDGYLSSIRVSWADTELGRDPTGSAIRTGTTQINQNCLTNPVMGPWREAALKRGYRSSIALPLISQDCTLGALTIYAVEPEIFSSDEVKLLEELATNLAFGIETLHLHTMRAAAEKELDGHRHKLEDLVALRTLELAAAKAAAERANNAKSRFLAAASHDLRQPLSALSLYVGALGDKLAPENRQLAANMGECVANLSEMLSNLLDLSKLDAGVVTPNIGDFALNPLITRVVLSHAPEARMKGLDLRYGYFDVIGRSDPMLFQRIVGNLVANAIRYTEHGGVLIGCRRRQGRTWVEVWDTGIGIPADKRAEIFEEFKQLGNAERNRAKGTGLGLAIVAKTATLLGLRVRVHSRPGKGSVFAVELPLGEAVEPVVTRQYTHRPLRIALVEDNVEVATALVYALTQIGHQVVAASSRAELLPRLDGIAPDIVISDYRLAGEEDGLGVIGALRAAFGSDLPAIIITGDTDPAVIRRMAEERIRVQHKPFELEALRSRIADLTAAATGV